MTVKFSTVNEADYQAYLSWAIKDYAKDKVDAGTWKEEEALQRSEESFKGYLPEGIRTKNQYLYAINDSEQEQTVGYLWVSLNGERTIKKFFIYDFTIFPEYQGQGYGSQTLKELEYLARTMQIEEIGLHVFAHNKVAIHLYEKVGFQATDITMVKSVQ